jgi:hypothetical protein
MKCPICGCQNFYIKNPDDEFETHEFNVAGGETSFSAGAEGGPVPELQETTEAFCNRCSWHGRFEELKKT